MGTLRLPCSVILYVKVTNIFFYYIIIYMIIVAQALLGLNGRLQAAMALPRDSLAARMLQRGTLQALNLLSKARGLAT